ncbi:FK506-binding protein 59-like [Musca autumnalis]|uniref:FK506-binding protein 59-like n=1 Tax=Musca autumnalis TaxID=221902 RepID=UPI003CF9F67C
MFADIRPTKDGRICRFTISRRGPNDGFLCKAHITGKYDGKVVEERDVEFNLGEGSDVGFIEGVEIAFEEESRFKIKPEEGRIEHSKIYKEKGTEYFKKENYALALKMFEKCEDILLNNSDEESNELKAAAYNNQALCHTMLNEDYDAKQACNEILRLEPNNIKALYRRGQYYIAVANYYEALADFWKIQNLEPSNKAAQNQIKICRRKIKEDKDRGTRQCIILIFGFSFSILLLAVLHQSIFNPVLSVLRDWA